MTVIVETTPKTIVLELSKFDAEIIASCMDNLSFGLVKFYGVRRIERLIKRLRGEYIIKK